MITSELKLTTGEVVKKLTQPCSCLVITEEGNQIILNRHHLLKTENKYKPHGVLTMRTSNQKQIIINKCNVHSINKPQPLRQDT